MHCVCRATWTPCPPTTHRCPLPPLLPAAKLDPLGLDERPPVVELDPAFYGFTEKDLDRE